MKACSKARRDFSGAARWSGRIRRSSAFSRTINSRKSTRRTATTSSAWWWPTGIATMPCDAAHDNDYGLIRRQQIEAANSVLLHDFYFRNSRSNR